MPVTLSEEYISLRLTEAIEAVDHSQDGYAEIDLSDETRLKCAAVLIPLVWHDEEWHLLFTRRTDRVESHKGQVSFLGGACDEGETTPEETALREAEEEIGIDPGDIRVLGRMANLITITYFRVASVAGLVFDQSGDFAMRIADQHYLGTVETDRVDAANQIAVAREYGEVIAHPMATAKVDADSAPPVRRIAENHIREFEFLTGALLPSKELPEACVFSSRLFGFTHLQFECFVFPAKTVQFADEFRAWQQSVTGFCGEALGSVGEAKQREEGTPDGKLEAGGGLTRQINNYQSQNQHQSQRNVMRPFEHPFSLSA